MVICESRRGPGFETSRIVYIAAMHARADIPWRCRQWSMSKKKQARTAAGRRAREKAPVIGEHFAPPRPKASILPRRSLTNDEADKLWALVQRCRPPDADANDAAAFGSEVMSLASLLSGAGNRYDKLRIDVEEAKRFYLNDAAYLPDVPTIRKRLKSLEADIEWFLNCLPHPAEAVSDFLEKTYTGEVFLKDSLRPAEEEMSQRKEAWLAKYGFEALRDSLSEFRGNMQYAQSLLSGTRTRHFSQDRFVGYLLGAWKTAIGKQPTSGRNAHKDSNYTTPQSGPFAEFVRAVNGMLPKGFRIERLDHAIRKALEPPT